VTSTTDVGNPTSPLLDVRGLTIGYRRGDRVTLVADSVSFSVQAGEIFGLVGESGSGKTTVVRGLIRLLPRSGVTLGGSIWFRGTNLLALPPQEMVRIRGTRIAMISQDPLTALNPVLTVETQIGEPIRYHERVRGAELRKRVLEIMDLVGIPEPGRRLRAYPHELSGGLRQRVAIAAALIGAPDMLLADEPTTALDVTIQDQILRLLVSLRDRMGMGVVMVTHDIGIVAQTCDKLAVMYAGRIAETGPVRTVLRHPAHPYTRALLGSIPRSREVDARLVPIPGSPPEPGNLPEGCPFQPRCGYATDACTQVRPELVEHAPGHLAACLHHDLVGA
jgi:peptide/nickel transport system ATP-binding protein